MLRRRRHVAKAPAACSPGLRADSLMMTCCLPVMDATGGLQRHTHGHTRMKGMIWKACVILRKTTFGKQQLRTFSSSSLLFAKLALKTTHLALHM